MRQMMLVVVTWLLHPLLLRLELLLDHLRMLLLILVIDNWGLAGGHQAVTADLQLPLIQLLLNPEV
jgi:hypothetical protein